MAFRAGSRSVPVGGFLLDTNVISELMKRRPNRNVAAWVDATAEDLLYVSVITVGEVRKGIDLLSDADPKRAALQSWLDRDVRARFSGRLLVFDDDRPKAPPSRNSSPLRPTVFSKVAA